MNSRSVDYLWTMKTMDTIKVDTHVIDYAGVTLHSAYMIGCLNTQVHQIIVMK